mgnify:CR=1 FL=1
MTLRQFVRVVLYRIRKRPPAFKERMAIHPQHWCDKGELTEKDMQSHGARK